MKNDDDYWETLNVFPEWYFNNEWYDVVTPEATIDALLKAVEDMLGDEPDQWKRQKLTFIQDGIRILEDMQKKQSKENKGGTMTLDELVNTLREEHKNLCAYLTDLDEATTGLYEPGGSIDEVKRSLWHINECYFSAFLALNN